MMQPSGTVAVAIDWKSESVRAETDEAMRRTTWASRADGLVEHVVFRAIPQARPGRQASSSLARSRRATAENSRVVRPRLEACRVDLFFRLLSYSCRYLPLLRRVCWSSYLFSFLLVFAARRSLASR